MQIKNLYTVLLVILFLTSSFAQLPWQSEIVYFNDGGKLVYVSDSEGNRIPDFSYAGYKNSEKEIPDVPVVKTISPIEGDNLQHIQNAINEVGAMPLNNGIRGALLLTAGIYDISNTLKINFDGVVLRGVGDKENPDSNTIIYLRTTFQRTALLAGGGTSSKWAQQISGSKTNITTDTIYVGEKEFEVENISPFSVGDNIIIFHPSTDGWLQAIDYGGTHSGESGSDPEDIPWAPGDENILYNRYIKEINGNKITIDAPVFNTLIRNNSQSYVYKYARTGLKTNIGIENLRIDMETAGGLDELHGWQGIDLYLIEDAWVRNCTMIHFGQSGIRTNTASRITIENCNAIDPVSKIEGERRYNFNMYTASQLILLKNCNATNGRHHYVSNGFSYTSGCVFLDCTSRGAYTSSEGHRRWTQGFLFDNHIELDGPRPGLNPRLLGLYNRGYYGTSHGWGIAHSVAWNCDVANGDLIVQKPPTAQNYAIGCSGANITGVKPPSPFDEPEGYIEGTNTPNLNPRSLFIAQLEERLNVVSVKNDYAANEVNEFYLYQNYPNPFNPETTIGYSLNADKRIIVEIYNLIGEKVIVIKDEIQEKGYHEIKFNSQNLLSSGIYFYVMRTDSKTDLKKMILLK
jgi:hypothetical protein